MTKVRFATLFTFLVPPKPYFYKEKALQISKTKCTRASVCPCLLGKKFHQNLGGGNFHLSLYMKDWAVKIIPKWRGGINGYCL